MIISSYVRLSVIVVLLAHSTALAITQTNPIPTGQIVERIEALNDSSQSYALYLPSNYTPNRKWPVRPFKEGAEKYGWIVLGSHNSRNGPWNVTAKAWNAILTDAHQRFAIDDERSYATGFSGGAPAAVRIAAACKCLAGVIANGAGFPVDLAPSPQMHFVFFGAAGVDDFNYPELRNLQEPLTKAGIVHRFQAFA